MELIKRKKPFIIAICEMKPKNKSERTINDYAVPYYALYETNLESTTGRGIAVYIHSSIAHTIIELETPDFSESCLLEMKLYKKDTLLFGCFYRSPSVNADSKENNNNLNQLLKSLCSNKKYSHICFIGDFNFKDINWESGTTSKSEESKETQFIETIRDCFLYQNITEPTRSRGRDEPSTIDLLFTNEITQVSNIEYRAPLGKSDHSVILFDYNCYLDNLSSSKKFLYDKADFIAIKDHLKDQNWEETFCTASRDKDIEDLWQLFQTKMIGLRNEFVDTRACGKPTWKSKGDIPLDQQLRDTIKEKTRLHRRWIKNKDGADRERHRRAYVTVRNTVKSQVRRAKRDFEKDIVDRSKQCPKIFWSYTRSKLKTKSGVSALLQDSFDKMSVMFGDKEKADILQNQFTSVFTKEPEGDLPGFDTRTLTDIGPLEITAELVKQKINNLDVNKASGPDEIHPRLLKELVNEVSTPLAIIFNKSLRDETVPADWKNAHVSPIYKKGARNIAANYRPISLTSIVCKIMESIVKDRILAHLTQEKLFSNHQYGFIPGRSTTTQLLSYLNTCIEAIAEGDVVDTIYFDFAKAFDTVPHRRLMKKLKAYGIGGQILNWIQSFLQGRTQTVKVNGVKSDAAAVLSGIPQGSVLGPILFVIYINDLPDAVKSSVYLFADDTKIFSRIKTMDDALILQNDVTALEQWSQTWLLKFHPDKCHVLTLGKHQNIVYAHPYLLNNQQLDHVFEEKDLGVILDSNLRFEEHIATKVKKANSIVGLIRRSFSYLDGKLLKTLFTSFVRPHLEYAQAVWAPHLKKNINSIENVQRRATKLADGFKNLSHLERLKKLELPTLVYRRLRNDMIEIYKHFHVYDRSTLSSAFRHQTRTSRRHNYQLVPRISRDGIRGLQRNSFYFRTIKQWNELPAEVVDSPSTDMFKTALDRIWEHHHLRYNL